MTSGRSFTRSSIFASIAGLLLSAGCGTAPKEARPPEAAAPATQAAPATPAAPATQAAEPVAAGGEAAHAPEAPGQPAPGAAAATGSKMVSSAYHDVVLTPAAQIQAEKFVCICGCKKILAGCTCTNTPGSIDMKKHLQSLVSRGLRSSEIEKEMVAKYGAAVVP